MSLIRPLRLPLLLYSYIASELLAPFFASFLILYGVFFLVRLIPFLDVVLDLQIGFADFVRLFAYLFPHMLLYVIPMASMTGVIIGFTRMTNDREIMALKACGISLRQMLPPVVAIALVISLCTGFFSVRLIPAGEVAMRQLMFQLAKEKIDKGLKEKKFTEALGDLVVYVDHIDKQEKWHGVYVSDMRGRKQPIITMAQGGYMHAEIDRMRVTIVLTKGTLHNTDGMDNQVIRFRRYQLQIPLRPATRIGGDDLTHLSRGAMTQEQLQRMADRYGRHTARGVKYLTEYHHRLVLPVGCFILSLLGFPLGLQAGAGKKAAGIPLGLAFFVLYYITFTVARVLCDDRAVPLVVGMWLPDILFALLTAVIFWRVDHERAIIPERLQQGLWRLAHQCRPLVRMVGRLVRKLLSRRRFERTPLPEEQPVAPVQMIHADTRKGVFHYPECRQYDCPSCTLIFPDARRALHFGYEPCPFCRDILKRHQDREDG